MNIKRLLFRILATASMAILAACQTTPTAETAATTPEPTATQQAAPVASQEAPPSQQASEQGAPVAVFLADTEMQEGWQAVQLSEGALYLNPQPVIERNDLIGIQAGANKEGDGLLALELSAEGQSKVTQVTTQFPNKRLALIVGQTMLAAPGYTVPVTNASLVFVVGSEQNAMAAARAIAGVNDGEVEPDAAGASQPAAQ